MRYLCLDLGERRTGVAVGDDETGVVTPLDVLAIAPGPALDAAVDAAVARHEPDAVVVGLPLNMDGTEGPPAAAARRVADAVAGRTGLPVHVQDERLTSFAAEQHLAGSGRTHRGKARVRDALAAAEILRDFLREK
ncbi:MAG: Holliday junction resolvase RuvX [Planctomycetota bacterium]